MSHVIVKDTNANIGTGYERVIIPEIYGFFPGN